MYYVHSSLTPLKTYPFALYISFLHTCIQSNARAHIVIFFFLINITYMCKCRNTRFPDAQKCKKKPLDITRFDVSLK